MSTARFQKLPQAYKFVIGSIPEINEEAVTIEAQFNPKELQIDSPIGWKEHKAIGAQLVASKPMEFTGMGVESLKVELTFDAYEDDSDAVVTAIDQLKKLASVRDPKSNVSDKRRPAFCVATWGTQAPFRCVIESLSVKYTMFAIDGTPVRATVVLGLKSGQRVAGDGGTAFEQRSAARLDAQRTQLKQERSDRQAADRKRIADERSSAEERSSRERSLASRERAVAEQRATSERARENREREIEREQQLRARERSVAADEKQLAADREQRKRDAGLE